MKFVAKTKYASNKAMHNNMYGLNSVFKYFSYEET